MFSHNVPLAAVPFELSVGFERHGGKRLFYVLFIHFLKFKIMACPKEIRTNHDFMNSVFQNSECETILRNIILLQKEANPEAWTPFSWGDYKAFCTHNVTDKEKGVLDAFVNGGKPVWNTSAYLSAGWLDFDGSN